MSFERCGASRRGGHNAFVNFGQVQVELIEPQDPSTMGAHHAMNHVGYVTQAIHTFASMLIQAGKSLAYVKEQLGHSSVTITVDTHGHRIAGTNKAAVDRLDDATRRNSGATGVAGTLRIATGGGVSVYEMSGKSRYHSRYAGRGLADLSDVSNVLIGQVQAPG